MRKFIAALIAALSRAPAFVTRAVRVAGKWVLALIPNPAAQYAPPAPEVEEIEANNINSHSADETVLFTLRRVLRAYSIGERPDPEDLQALPELTRDWVRVLDQRQVQICLCADDSQLEAHLRGRQPFKGVVPHESAAVAEFQRVRNLDRRQALMERAAIKRRRHEKEAAPELQF